jgi:putative transcriptional regulator
MIRHHPSEATLVAYAAGSLPEPHIRTVAVHLALCPACAAALAELTEIGGALIEAIEPSRLAPDALARTLARLDAPARLEPPPPAVTLDAVAIKHWRWTGPGIAMMTLIARDRTGTRLDLIRVAPGTGLLHHGHTGFETTCVMRGAYHDGLDRYETGDFAESDPSEQHRPMALPGEDCICLMATTGMLRPTGLLGRLIRPLLGM